MCHRVRRVEAWSEIIGIPFFAFVLMLCFASQGRAQYTLQIGAPTFTTAEPVEMGFVNAGNGNLHLEIPITTAAQRGSLAFTAALVYDSRIWKVSGSVWSPTNVPSSSGGWRFTTSGSVSANYDSQYFGCSPVGYGYTYNNFRWTGPDGTVRLFPIQTFHKMSGCPYNDDVPTGSAFAFDSAGYYMTVTNYTTMTVYARDGTQVYPAMKDTNGNYFTGSTVDTLNRTQVVSESGGTGNCTGASYCYKFLNSQDSDVRVKVTTTTVNVKTNFGQSGVTEYTGSFTAIQSVSFPGPGGAWYTYSFTYDSGTTPGYFGLLKSVTLPTGQQVNYTHTTFQDAAGNKQRWVSSRTSGGGTWSYTPALISVCPSGNSGCQQKVTVTQPSGDYTIHAAKLDGGAWTLESFDYNSSGTPYRKNFKEYTTGPNYVRTLKATTQIQNAGGTWISSKKEYEYDDQYKGNVTQVREWKFYTGTPPASADRKTVMTYETGSSYTAKNILNRVKNIQIQNSSGTKLAETKITYDSTSLTSETGVTHHDDANYGTGNTIRGNPTLIERWVSGSTYLSTTLSYDTLGNVRTILDPKGNSTTISYTDSFYTDDDSDPPTSCSLGVTAKAYPTTVTVPVVGSSTFGYYCKTGRMARTTDPNSQSTYFHFYDPLDRPTRTKQADTGYTRVEYTSAVLQDIYTALAPSVERQDRVQFDSLGRVTMNYLMNDPEGTTCLQTTYDSSGRVWTVSNPSRFCAALPDKDTYAYDPLSRVKQVTHPDSTNAYTYYGNDVGTPGGRTTQLCASGTYGLGYATLYVDEAGKKRQTWTDGLGRLIEVDEPDASTGSLTTGNVYNTCYTYNLQDNLTGVVQGGQTRSYTYDNLGRVTAATTPESGTTNFYYTTAGGTLCSGDPSAVCRRTDARSITTTYAYDALNRLTSKSYSDSTPKANFFYDNSTPDIPNWPGGTTLSNVTGRLSYSCTSNTVGSCTGLTTATVYSYDAAGRVKDYWQCTPENCSTAPATWKTTYNYDLAGDVTSWVHPAGFTITNTISTAQRITQVSSSISDASRPAVLADVTYHPFGAIKTLLNGAAAGGTRIQETYDYNNRLQPVRIQLGTALNNAANSCLVYNYYSGTAPGNCAVPTPGASGNNGNVQSFRYEDTANSALAHKGSYCYDALNRLSKAIAQTLAAADPTDCVSASNIWSQSYTYDRWGNPSCSGSGICTAITYEAANNNRIYQVGSQTVTEDAAGNITQDLSEIPTRSYQWDAEGRLKSVDNGSTWSATYNALGQQVQRSASSWRMEILYDAFGGELATYDGISNAWWAQNAALGSRNLAVYFSNYVRFIHPNHLGTTSFVTNGLGACLQDQRYYPWGQTWDNACGQHDMHFASMQQQDPTTGLDVTAFRMYRPRLYRWLSPDPMAGSILDPQSLNRYSYVGNNPVNFVDPLGLCPLGTHKVDLAAAAESLKGYPYGGPWVKRDKAGNIVSMDCTGLVGLAMTRSVPGYTNEKVTISNIMDGVGPFYRVQTPQVGDIAVLSYRGRRDNGHLAVVTNTSPLQLVGAQSKGVDTIKATSDWYQKNVFANTDDMDFPDRRPQYFEVCVSDKIAPKPTYITIAGYAGSQSPGSWGSMWPGSITDAVCMMFALVNCGRGNREDVRSTIRPCGGPGQPPCPD